MSRIGKKAIAVPAGVEVSVNGQTINVKGPKGQLEYTAQDVVTVSFDADAKTISITANDEARQTSAFQVSLVPSWTTWLLAFPLVGKKNSKSVVRVIVVLFKAKS